MVTCPAALFLETRATQTKRNHIFIRICHALSRSLGGPTQDPTPARYGPQADPRMTGRPASFRRLSEDFATAAQFTVIPGASVNVLPFRKLTHTLDEFDIGHATVGALLRPFYVLIPNRENLPELLVAAPKSMARCKITREKTGKW